MNLEKEINDDALKMAWANLQERIRKIKQGGGKSRLKRLSEQGKLSARERINKLVDKGNTILIIEHNMDVIKLADYIIDIGPEGGKGGGEVVAKGTPEEIVKNKKSYTAQFLKKELL